jgi:hypothetical protein
MDKSLGQDIKDVIKRKRFLEDNSDEVVKKTYMKPYTGPELQGKKEELASTLIEISEIEQEKAEVLAGIKGRLKPLLEAKTTLVGNIKAKAELVTEECYRITDQEDGMTGFYNANGDLIESRRATADEMQGSLFKQPTIKVVTAKTGTDDMSAPSRVIQS